MMTEPVDSFEDRPWIYSVLEVSTGHLTKTEADLLRNRSDIPIAVYDYEYGWFVHVAWVSGEHVDTIKALKAFGFGEHFIEILKRAQELGCKFVAFDGDGFVYDDIPQFNW